MKEEILFVGPVAQQGGPAIKNRILVEYLSRSGSIKIWNTFDQSLKNRMGAILAILFAKQRYIIVSVSAKGRNILYPILWLKRRVCPIHYSCIVIGGYVIGSFWTQISIKAMREADLVTVETHGIKSHMEHHYKLEHLYWMPNYKDIDHFPEITKMRFQQPVLRFLFLSSMRDVKGVGTLLEAFQKVLQEGYSVSLDYYGPVKHDLNPVFLEKMNSCEWIHYQGVVENQQVLAVMEQYQVFVFPTEYTGEGFPAVLVEAQAAGLPVIASDMNNNPEIISDGRNGWIFEHGRVDQLAERIKYCVLHREELYNISKNNLQDAKQYHAASVIGKYQNELRELGWPV